MEVKVTKKTKTKVDFTTWGLGAVNVRGHFYLYQVFDTGTWERARPGQD